MSSRARCGRHADHRLPRRRPAPVVRLVVNVWYTLLTAGSDGVDAEFILIDYDHPALAREMRNEKLLEEFIETIETGWWTTCLEILPASIS